MLQSRNSNLDRHNGSRVLWLSMVLGGIVGCGAENSVQPHSDNPPEVPAELPSELVAGQKVYKENCSLCHDHGEGGAPKVGIPRKWEKRASKGLETLTQNAFDGFEGMWGEMPAQGESLSRDEVASAVEFMLYRFEQAKVTELAE